MLLKQKDYKDLTDEERLIMQAMYEISADKIGFEELRKLKTSERLPWMSADQIRDKIVEILERNKKKMEWDK